MRRFLTIDLFAGIGAFAWATAALFVEPLNELVDFRAAGAFGLAALGRWVTAMRSAPAKLEGSTEPKNPKEL